MSKLLNDAHRDSLERQSGISAEIVKEMGVWTATTKDDLASLGFKQADIKPPALVFPVFTWAEGDHPAYNRIKPDHPRCDARGKPRKYEQPPGQACRIYCLPTSRQLIRGLQGVTGCNAPTLPYLFVTEGEKKAASLVSRGLAALGLPGVWNFKNEQSLRGDWDLIVSKRLNVCIIFDSDAATNEQVRMAEDRLASLLRAMNANVFVCRLPQGKNGEKTGVDDFFVQGGTVDDLAVFIEEHQPEKPGAKPSSADGLIELGSRRAILWHDSRRDAFATVPLALGGFDNLSVRERRFREWLGGEWYRSHKGSPPREAMDRAVDALAARAIYDGEQRETSKRIGHSEGSVWVDLCDRERRIVRITADGWDFVSDGACPVRFLRPENMQAMPQPMRGGTLEGLKKLLSVTAEGLMAIEAYMLGAFMPPPGGFPILAVTGEQGSGKSFGCRVIRSVLDPSVLALRGAPKDDGDLGASLNSGFLLAFDNLSKVSGWLSDGLCSLATGGGLARRELYTNADEHVVTGRRPVLLNGINDVVTAPDLAERCLFVEFIRPTDAERLTETELESRWERERGHVLGAILDRVSRALRDRGKVSPGALPRLADFAQWVYAGTPEAQRDEVWRVLAENRRAKNLSTIEDHPLASAVWTLAKNGGFEGTARELLAQLNEQEGVIGRNKGPEGWPASADGLGKSLRRLIPVFGAVGIEVSQRRGKERVWTVASVDSSQASKVSQVTAGSFMEPDATVSPDDTYQAADDACLHEASSAVSRSLTLHVHDCDTSDASDTSCSSVTEGERRIEWL